MGSVCSYGKIDPYPKPHNLTFGNIVELDKKIITCSYTALKHHSIKMNELELHVSTWINLRNIILSKKSKLQKISYNMIPFI